MPDQEVLDAAANAELDHLIAITMQLLGASSAYDLKPRDQTGSTTLFKGNGIHWTGENAVPDACA